MKRGLLIYLLTLSAILAVIATGVGVFAPMLRHWRPENAQIHCQSNLRGIGIALQLYANQFGQYPPTFGELILTQEISAASFYCSGDESGTYSKATDPAVAAADITDANRHHCSYLYAGERLDPTRLTGDELLAFERTSNHAYHPEAGFHVLLQSGEVRWIPALPGTEGAAIAQRLQADDAAGVRPLRLRN